MHAFSCACNNYTFRYLARLVVAVRSEQVRSIMQFQVILSVFVCALAGATETFAPFVVLDAIRVALAGSASDSVMEAFVAKDFAAIQSELTMMAETADEEEEQLAISTKAVLSLAALECDMKSDNFIFEETLVVAFDQLSGADRPRSPLRSPSFVLHAQSLEWLGIVYARCFPNTLPAIGFYGRSLLIASFSSQRPAASLRGSHPAVIELPDIGPVIELPEELLVQQDDPVESTVHADAAVSDTPTVQLPAGGPALRRRRASDTATQVGVGVAVSVCVCVCVLVVAVAVVLMTQDKRKEIQSEDAVEEEAAVVEDVAVGVAVDVAADEAADEAEETGPVSSATGLTGDIVEVPASANGEEPEEVEIAADEPLMSAAEAQLPFEEVPKVEDSIELSVEKDQEDCEYIPCN